MALFEGYTCVLDVETGGFSTKDNLLTEIGFIILNPKLEEVERYVSYIKPYDSSKYLTKKAQELTGITMEVLLEKGKDLKFVLEEIKAIWAKYKKKYQKICLCGHNFKFDITFMEYVFDFVEGKQPDGKSAIYKYVDEQTEDTMRLAHRKWGNSGEVADYKLGTLASHIGFTNTAAHDALYDVEATVVLFRYLIGCLQGDGGQVVSKENKGFVFQF